MKIDILTLFPEMFNGFKESSIIKRAINKGLVEINIINFRDYSKLNNKQVDDAPYGGGAGMVLMCDPIVRAIEDLRSNDSLVILLCPQGKIFNQKKVKELSEYRHLIIICGHYEGFDERVKSFADERISIGDYILTGGEVPAMAICDSVVRLIDGAISNDSLLYESFDDELLDYPVYTKPRCFNGTMVPDVLLSGDHKKIEEYRQSERKRITKEKYNK